MHVRANAFLFTSGRRCMTASRSRPARCARQAAAACPRRRAGGALEAKVLVRAARVVRGGQDEASVGLPAVAGADDRRHRGRRQQAVHTDPHL